MKYALVLGAGGFIGSHMVERLKSEGYWVRGVDLKYPEFHRTYADEFLIYDLTIASNVKAVMRLNRNLFFSYTVNPFERVIDFDEIYQFAADMGGAGYVFSGDNDAEIMRNSALINLNVLSEVKDSKIFYSSSACIYPEELQKEYNNVSLSESDAYPAHPDSAYGWEKLFSENLYESFRNNRGIDIRIARFHNIFGEKGTYKGGKEKAPAAICRKVASSKDEVEIWGNGLQTRSFLYIDECIEAVRRLMDSNYDKPINIGSSEMISINDLAKMVIKLSCKDLSIKNIEGFTGVSGRNSNNELIEKVLGWKPTQPLIEGIEKTYNWIENELITN